MKLTKIASLVTLPFNPYLRYVSWSVKLLNSFPQDLVEQVPEDHQTIQAAIDAAASGSRSRYLKTSSTGSP